MSPDLARFKMSSLTEDVVGLLSNRAYDIAESMANTDGKKLVVALNGKKVSLNTNPIKFCFNSFGKMSVHHDVY